METRDPPPTDRLIADFAAVNALVEKLLDAVRTQTIAATGVLEQRPQTTACQSAMMVLVHACQRMGVNPRYARDAVTALILDTLSNFMLMQSGDAAGAVAAAEEAAAQFLENFRRDAPAHFAMRKASAQ